MAIEPRGADRRRHERHTLIAQVRVQRVQEDIVMELVNISLSGALVDMGSIARPRWLELGRELNIAITHPVSLALLQLTGKVRRIVEEEDSTEFAVEFSETDEASTAVLRDLVALAIESVLPASSPKPPPLPQR